MDPFKTVLEKVDIINHVKKSKFIGVAIPIRSISDFEEQLIEIKKQHQGANHYCYAYRLTDNILLERYQDDKEPSGTAGVPILDVLKGQDLRECAIVVVRYFGGTKLGTGGLSRAYSDAARDVLELGNIVSKEEVYYVNIDVEYHFSGKIEYHINSKEIPLMATAYESRVIYTVAIPLDEVVGFENDINELTSGQSNIQRMKKVIGFFNKNQFIPN